MHHDNAGTVFPDVLKPTVEPVESFFAVWPHVTAWLGPEEPERIVAIVSPNRDEQTVVPVGGDVGPLPEHLIVGRHSQCDIRLTGEDVALRQLLIRFGSNPTNRVLDLNSRTRMVDGQHRLCGAVAGDSHIVGGFLDFHIFVIDVPALLSAVDEDKIHDASKCWPVVAATIDQAEVVATTPSATPNKTGQPGWNPGHTVTVFGNATWLGDPLDQREPPAGYLLGPPDSNWKVPVSHKALAGGVLLGRYKRCRIPLPGGQNEDKLSRVHACIIGDGHGVWVFDTASRNGLSRAGEDDVRAIRLDSGDAFSLADEVVLRWEKAGH